MLGIIGETFLRFLICGLGWIFDFIKISIRSYPTSSIMRLNRTPNRGVPVHCQP